MSDRPIPLGSRNLRRGRPGGASKGCSAYTRDVREAGAVAGDRNECNKWFGIALECVIHARGGRIQVKLARIDQHQCGCDNAADQCRLSAYVFDRFRQADSPIRGNMAFSSVFHRKISPSFTGQCGAESGGEGKVTLFIVGAVVAFIKKTCG